MSVAQPVYPVVFFDALRVKIREDAVVRNKAIYLALGVQSDGTRDILGLWIENTEGAKFWMKAFNDLKTRGVNDILIAVTDQQNDLRAANEHAHSLKTDCPVALHHHGFQSHIRVGRLLDL